MIWRDVILSLLPPKTGLSRTLAEVFDVAYEQVDVVDLVKDISVEYSVNCIVSKVSGTFPWLLSFYLDFEVNDDLSIVVRLCAAFSCEALISNDENLDPYPMVLVNQSMEARIVNIDLERLEEDEAYVVCVM
ncbi:MAG: hypothetical protein F6J87_04900 [Spirulina sp. SIO3F2]|nr:hypothetical protein [Spirulina sp. SIO3F2]